MAELYIGLMSGTSLDGVDGVLVDFSTTPLRVVAHHSAPFEPALRTELLALNTASHDELHRAALASNGLVRCYAQTVAALLNTTGASTNDIQAIGAHGQTVRHQPGLHDGIGYTTQLNNPALLAELTDIAVVADFRSRDIAAGGQGAPLVPVFHQGVFGRTDHTVGVLNIGGIANLSVLRPGAAAQGFDCGPGNALLDHWCLTHTGRTYDDRGQWAAGGQVQSALLASLLSEPFLHRLPPKSTGRDLFHPEWLRHHLQTCPGTAPVDIQTTLTEFTARACAQDVLRHAASARELLVCGGGALNEWLMHRLQAHLPGVQVASSATRGLPPLQVEAAAFAWLARQTLRGLPGSLPNVTGARGARMLGAVYPR